MSGSDDAEVVARIETHLSERTARGLAHAISAAVAAGELNEGQRMPPIRTVARHLALSPTTVSAGWALLSRAGTISTDGRRGTVITRARTPGPGRYRRAVDRRVQFALDLSTGVPDPALLPNLAPALRRLRFGLSPNSYLDEVVVPELLEWLHNDWPFDAEQITMVDGAMDAIDQALASTLRFGDRVIVEHPCFPPLLDLLDAVGAQVVGVPVDAEGLLPNALAQALRTGAVAVILQPRAQNPTGAFLTRKRAIELARVIQPTSSIVVEDDSAGAIATADAISLGRWLPGRVLHIRSFSKSHGPDLRLAALGGPTALLEPVTERRLLGQGWTSRLLQTLLLDLVTDSDSVGAVSNARREYAHRRRLVVTELRRNGLDLPDGDGINLWIPVHDESAALLSLASHGIGAAAGAPFDVLPDAGDHIRITVGLITAQHAAIARLLASAAFAAMAGSPR